MKLSGLSKMVSLISTKIREALKDPHPELSKGEQAREAVIDRHQGMSVSLRQAYGEQSAVILEEKRRQVRIQCWSCGKPQWVHRGSKAHQLGLCGSCVAEFDANSDTVLKKATR